MNADHAGAGVCGMRKDEEADDEDDAELLWLLDAEANAG